LWWGHRIPAWYSEKGDIFVAKTYEEAIIKAKAKYEKEVELKQDEDVLDTWFSSGLWPFSTLDWPKKNNYLLNHYPGDILVTGFDIIFFWVARMMMLGIHFMNKSPFKEVYVHALVRDSKGDKMSKSKGNAVDPLKLMGKYGTDSIRFTLAALATQGRDIKLSEDRIVGYRNFLTKINNVSRFLEINRCKLDDNFDFSNVKLSVNHWILNLLDDFTDKVYKDITSYRFNEAANNLYQFVWHYYCDWYIEFVKIIINKKDSEEVKNVAAYVFKKILILLHPLVPFSTEYLYSKKHKFGSVLALEKWSKDDVDLRVSKENLVEVNWIIKLISEIRSLRNILNIEFKSLINLNFIELDSLKINYISNNEYVIKDIAKVGEIKQIANEENDVAQILVDNATFYIPLKGLIDIDKEYDRLNIDLTKLKNDIFIIDKKLNNKDFLKRAPEEIINEQKDRKLRLVGSVEKINMALEKISK